MHPPRRADTLPGSMARRFAPFMLLAVFSPLAGAATTDDLVAAAARLRQIETQSQARVDALDDETRALRHELTGLDDAVDAYAQRVADLDTRLADLEAQVAGVNAEAAAAEATAGQILPLMASMIDSLERFVTLDLPFQTRARSDDVARLRDTMIRADLKTADKFRRIVAAWRREIDFGYTLGTYRDRAPGDDRIVELFRLGRTALYLRTPGRDEAALWLADERRWLSLGATDRAALDRAIAIAQRARLPELLQLPMALPERAP